LYVIGGLAMEADAVPLDPLREELDLSQDALTRLIDALVARGYIERAAHDDRQSDRFVLTARGRAAAIAHAAARERGDAELAARVGAECVGQMRRALGALCAIGRQPTRP